MSYINRFRQNLLALMLLSVLSLGCARRNRQDLVVYNDTLNDLIDARVLLEPDGVRLRAPRLLYGPGNIIPDVVAPEAERITLSWTGEETGQRFRRGPVPIGAPTEPTNPKYGYEVELVVAADSSLSARWRPFASVRREVDGGQ